LNILYITYPLSGILIITLVFALTIFLIRKYSLRWRLFFIGAIGFLISQIFHIPFNSRVLNPLIQNQIQPQLPEVLGLALTALLLGLSAGLFEEFTRYGLYRWWVRDARSWAKGVLLGTGWGGIEAILVAGIILATFFEMIALQGVDLSSVVPAEQVELAKQQVESYWSIPWHLSLLGFIERAFAIPIQISLSVLVLQVFNRGQSRWLWFAIGWHTLIDSAAVFVLTMWKDFAWIFYAVEALAGIFAIIALAIIFALKEPEPELEPIIPQPPEPLEASNLDEIEATLENLEDSRYN
jgi:uncharacterized membrane protein YhfC